MYDRKIGSFPIFLSYNFLSIVLPDHRQIQQCGRGRSRSTALQQSILDHNLPDYAEDFIRLKSFTEGDLRLLFQTTRNKCPASRCQSALAVAAA